MEGVFCKARWLAAWCAAALLVALVGLGLAAQPAYAEVQEGSCGFRLTYTLDTDTGALAISGEGILTPSFPFDKDIAQSVDISEGVTEIESYTFSEWPSLKSVSIPSTVTRIGRGAFMTCESLESVTIAEGLTEIDLAAFMECKSLKSITIPASVVTISENAFCLCSSLFVITFADGSQCTSIGKDAFHSLPPGFIFAPIDQCLFLVNSNAIESGKTRIVPTGEPGAYSREEIDAAIAAATRSEAGGFGEEGAKAYTAEEVDQLLAKAKVASDELIAELQDEVAVGKAVGATKSYKAAKKTGKLAKAKSFKLRSIKSKSGSKVTYKKANKAGGKLIKVASAGKVTLKKGLKRATYKVKVKATCGAASKNVTVKVKIK